MKEIAPNTYLIDAQYFQEGFNAVYLIVSQGKAMLVDCGTAHSVPHIEKAMAEIGLGWDDLDRIFLTHVHLDHSAGSGMIMQKAKNAKLWVHPRGYHHLVDPTKLVAGTKIVYTEQPLEEIFGEVIASPKERLMQTENNQEIDFYGKKFLIHHSPGHAKHHQSLFDLEQKIYFAGDTLGVCYRKWDLDRKIFAFLPSAPNQFEPEVWKNTLKEIQKLNLQKICVTHFGEVSSVSELLSQVEDLVDQFATIGLKHKNSENRKEKIATDLAEIFITKLQTETTRWSRTEIEEWIAKDILISVSGLEHWLDNL